VKMIPGLGLERDKERECVCVVWLRQYSTAAGQ
jgi:hypothetical protein